MTKRGIGKITNLENRLAMQPSRPQCRCKRNFKLFNDMVFVVKRDNIGNKFTKSGGGEGSMLECQEVTLKVPPLLQALGQSDHISRAFAHFPQYLCKGNIVGWPNDAVVE